MTAERHKCPAGRGQYLSVRVVNAPHAIRVVCTWCGETFGMGKARSDHYVDIEIDAARIVDHVKTHGYASLLLPAEQAGWEDSDAFSLSEGGLNPQWQAGALARAIHEHEEE